jgi:hypothetical protein
MDKMQQIIVCKWLDSQDSIDKYEYNPSDQEYTVFFTDDISLKLKRKLTFELNWFIIYNYENFQAVRLNWDERGLLSGFSWYDNLAN